MNIKFGTTKIFIENGLLNGRPVQNTEVNLVGLYAIDIKNTPVIDDAAITVNPSEPVILDRDTISRVVIITAPCCLKFDRSNELIGFEEEGYEVVDGRHIYNVRIVHGFMGEGKSALNIIVDDDNYCGDAAVEVVLR